jgi:GntR family transcriptional regulator
MEFSKDQPIYQQIIDFIKQRIIKGELLAGERMEAVRELALALVTNPNTVQRALSELEREEILFSRRGLGRFVTDDQEKIEELKTKEIEKVVERFLHDMKNLGLSYEEAKQYLLDLPDKIKED